MNNQKNRFWTFCFSLIPGAGEMYLGLYKQGISLMVSFIGIMALSVMLNLTPFALFAIVVWFYSFLHTHNLRAMPLEEYCNLEDDYIWSRVPLNMKWTNKAMKLTAILLIVLGIYLVWTNTFGWISWYFGGFIGGILNRLPQLAIGVAILWLGVKLITGKKVELDEMLGSEDEKSTEAPVADAVVPVLGAAPVETENASEDAQAAQNVKEVDGDAEA